MKKKEKIWENLSKIMQEENAQYDMSTQRGRHIPSKKQTQHL